MGCNNGTRVIPALIVSAIVLLVITVTFVAFEGGKLYKYNPRLFMLSLLRFTKFMSQEGGCGSIKLALASFIIASKRYT